MAHDPRKFMLKQAKRVTDAAFHLTKAADLLEKAKVDDIPDDLRNTAQSLECLAEQVKNYQPNSAKIYRMSDYQPTKHSPHQ